MAEFLNKTSRLFFRNPKKNNIAEKTNNIKSDSKNEHLTIGAFWQAQLINLSEDNKR